MQNLMFRVRGRCPLVGFAAALLAVMAFGVPAEVQNFSSWSPAVNLGPVVNSTSNGGCPFITKNGLSLYFRSDRPGGYGGFDVYVAQRASVSAPWGPPVNLGPKINTSSGEICNFVSDDGHWLYFISNRPGGCGGNDIYVLYRKT